MPRIASRCGLQISFAYAQINRPFSYSRKESKSNDVMMLFEEFSYVHNSDRTSNATRSNLAYKIITITLDPDSFCRIAKKSIKIK